MTPIEIAALYVFIGVMVGIVDYTQAVLSLDQAPIGEHIQVGLFWPVALFYWLVVIVRLAFLTED